MIIQHIQCEWPMCKAEQTECKEGMGFVGWGHIRGFNVDGESRDFHLCPQHVKYIMDHIREIKNGMDGP